MRPSHWSTDWCRGIKSHNRGVRRQWPMLSTGWWCRHFNHIPYNTSRAPRLFAGPQHCGCCRPRATKQSAQSFVRASKQKIKIRPVQSEPPLATLPAFWLELETTPSDSKPDYSIPIRASAQRSTIIAVRGHRLDSLIRSHQFVLISFAAIQEAAVAVLDVTTESETKSVLENRRK